MSHRKKNPDISRGGEVYLDDVTQKALADRLARVEGHLRSVRGMILSRRCADEILLQIAAVKAALNQFSAALLDHELKICMETCMTGSPDERLEKVTRVLSTLLKQS
ncbi:MAG: metal-sensitive transcriptional regulator [Candidatus Glassbacteria bacterium]